MTQGERINTHLRKRWMTTLDMLMLRISVCPWKRSREALKPNETLLKRKNARGLFEYRIGRVKV